MLRLLIFQICIWVAACVNAAVALYILRRASRRAGQAPSSAAVLLRRLANAALYVMLLAIPEFLIAAPFGGVKFGWLHIAYVFIAVIPPCLGVWMLCQLRRNASLPPASRWVVAAIGIVLLAPAGICAYASFVAPYQLVVERADVPVRLAAAKAQPVRIGVIADLQTDCASDYERSAIDRLMAEKPDVIVMPGDFFQVPSDAWEKRSASFRELLSRIRAPHGVYATLGNMDEQPRTRQLLAESGIKVLENAIEVVQVGDWRIALGGVEFTVGSPAALATMRGMRDVQADCRILLSHKPDAALEAVPEDRIDLIISGHTHGGQVVVPGFGPLMTLSRVPRQAAAGGLHTVNGQRLYVSRGVGLERLPAPPVRLFCPPEITVLTIMGSRE